MTDFKLIKDEILQLLSMSDLDLESEHGENTLNWVLRIKPDASLALQIAAVGHDIERSRPDRFRSEDFDDHKEYKRSHSEKGAVMLGELLKSFNLEESIINEVKELVRLHEVGGTEDADVLRDADSISFFDNNLDFYIRYKGIEAAKKQVEYKFSRCSKRAQGYIEDIDGYKRFCEKIG